MRHHRLAPTKFYFTSDRSVNDRSAHVSWAFRRIPVSYSAGAVIYNASNLLLQANRLGVAKELFC
jgi:hypothetical protein